MKKVSFITWNRIVAFVVLIIAAFTYLSTIAPSASFWDCGEFIASSYKLEVGHPPGNPVFQLFARFFTMFTDKAHAAMAINTMSALCSAFTIMILYLSIVFFAKRLRKPSKKDGKYSLSDMLIIFGSSAIGALAFCFTDSFWFSAVEAEVYAMSSLFTALVVWSMLKWYEEADQAHANRWIILISFLMGLSIGVHLLNLLAIPAIVFLYYYRKREDKPYTILEFIRIGLLSIIILAIVLYGIIPWIPKFAAYSDLFFVNVLGLPMNSGAVCFMLALFALCFALIFITYKRKQVFFNTIILSFTCILIGFSLFSIVVIRSNAMPPTNEDQPDNAFALMAYLSREQYGSTPLLYGQYFDSPYTIKYTKYWATVRQKDGKYKYVSKNNPGMPVYSSSSKMLFPRMWDGSRNVYKKIYSSYYRGGEQAIDGADYAKPTFMDNLRFFLNFQLDWMYWRYFLWNFVGRQNDVHSPSPGNIYYGNWESGIPFIDHARLGDQSMAPAPLRNNKGKNHYFFLPLLLGLIGLFYQAYKDQRGWWIVFLLFFMTGIAIVLYLNQSPLQVRERDYAYVGSFYAFAMWIGLAALAIFNMIFNSCKKANEGIKTCSAASLVVLGLIVPLIMACQNWNDHNRSNRRTAAEMASNYLNSAGKNGILITHGDNDTFPLWYAQEVEDVRPDVRICNTSLLGTDWHINQMRYACNKSEPLKLSIPQSSYLYGSNEYVPIADKLDTIVPIKDVIRIFNDPSALITMDDGTKMHYICSRKISIPVNKENVIKYGILPKSMADKIPSQIVLEIPQRKSFISKPELFLLDLLSNYQWKRPISILGMGGDLNIGIKDYLLYDGFSDRFVPIKNSLTAEGPTLLNTDELYNKMQHTYSWKNISKDNYFVDYQNFYTFLGVCEQRAIFYRTAQALYNEGKIEAAIKMLNKGFSILPFPTYAYDTICIGFINNDITMVKMIDLAIKLKQYKIVANVSKVFLQELMTGIKFYMRMEDKDYMGQELQVAGYLLSVLDDVKQEPKSNNPEIAKIIQLKTDYTKAIENIIRGN